MFGAAEGRLNRPGGISLRDPRCPSLKLLVIRRMAVENPPLIDIHS